MLYTDSLSVKLVCAYLKQNVIQHVYFNRKLLSSMNWNDSKNIKRLNI